MGAATWCLAVNLSKLLWVYVCYYSPYQQLYLSTFQNVGSSPYSPCIRLILQYFITVIRQVLFVQFLEIFIDKDTVRCFFFLTLNSVSSYAAFLRLGQNPNLRSTHIADSHVNRKCLRCKWDIYTSIWIPCVLSSCISAYSEHIAINS